MKYIDSIAVVAALGWLTGCASAPTIAIVEPVGPVPASERNALGQHSLQVYSVREKEPFDANYMEWRWDSSSAKDAFTYDIAHTDYIILTQDGKAFQYVRNARNLADPTPALVTLPPGHYKVKAEAEEYDGETVNVIIPVAIEPGRTTIAYLSGNWKPQGSFANADVVRLPDGQIAGWLAAH